MKLAYRKSYRSNYVLLRSIVSGVFTDFFKAYDSIPRDLLIANLHAYAFPLEALAFFYSYLKRL